ncbi:hypothetical protein [Streptomyces sp. LN549]|uniref:hypothetical protein n=1 Tax=Streptomyces sp. LN549 TaxID=3112979 RepID=UPI00372255CC
MSIRPDIAELLRAGCSDREVTRRLNVDNRTVATARTSLGLPLHKPGVRPASSPQDSFRQRTRPVDGGHLEWTGHRTNCGTPFFRWMKKGYTAGRIAFVMQHGREPIGYALPGCGYRGCVAPAHLEDQPMRDQLKTQMAGIFGGAA